MHRKLSVPQGTSTDDKRVAIRAKFYYKNLFFLFESLWINLDHFIERTPHSLLRGNRDMGSILWFLLEEQCSSRGHPLWVKDLL